MSEEPNDANEPAPTPDPPAAGDASGEVPSDDRTMALLAHLLGIFTGFIGCLVIWLIKKESSPFVDDQGKEALNFQITMLIAQLVAGVTVAFFIGCILLPAVMIVNVVFCILAAMAAGKGEAYRYPFNIRIIK